MRIQLSSSLCILANLVLAPTAWSKGAQTAPPGSNLAPPAARGTELSPSAPPAAPPAAGAPAPVPSPAGAVAQPAPVAQPPGAPAPVVPTTAPAPAAATPGFQAQGDEALRWSGDGSDGSAESDANLEPTENADAVQNRQASLALQNNFYGATGLTRISFAGSGAPGTFRLSLAGSLFSGTGVLCNSGHPCPIMREGDKAGDEESLDRLNSHINLSVSLWSFLEAYAGFHNQATSNSRSRPQLLQVLGDTNLGAKVFTPWAPDRWLSFGGQADLLFYNGLGGVGLSGPATSFSISALGTIDLNNRASADARIPLRFHFNAGYTVDNSGNIVTNIEENPKAPRHLTRPERFALGIQRVDFVKLGVGAEYVHEYIRPFVEWTLDIPSNRQEYECRLRTAQANGEGCLGQNQGLQTSPSRLTFGARVLPWQGHGLSVLLAADVGTSGTSTYVDELVPELPWLLHFGLGYAFDTEPPAPQVERVAVAAPVQNVLPSYYIEGVVLEKESQAAVPGATLVFDGRNLTGLVSKADGTFRTHDLQPGSYTFTVNSRGYRPGQCVATIVADTGATAAAAQPGGAPGTAPPTGQESASATAAPLPSTTTAPQATAAGGAKVTKVRCELEALPKVGNVIGTLTDGESQAPIGGAKVKITDKLQRELELVADTAGAFRFENVPPGVVSLRIEAPNYFPATIEVEVKPLEDSQPRITLNRRPEQPNVSVAGKEIKLKKQVHFQNDSSEILPDSLSLLDEIADLLQRKPDIRRVEVQGHTDDNGTPPYNLRLSQSRAQAVVEALVRLGIDSSRLVAKGYGQDKPLLPNLNEANRARNRRVQLVITE